MIFRALPSRPARVDIVCVYLPVEELPGIVAEHVLPLGATVLWLLGRSASPEERGLAREHGLVLVEGTDISAAAHEVRRARRAGS